MILQEPKSKFKLEEMTHRFWGEERTKNKRQKWADRFYGSREAFCTERVLFMDFCFLF